MIKVEVKPRQDNLFDVWIVASNGDLLLHSSQGYENVEDAQAVPRLLWPPIATPETVVFDPWEGGQKVPAGFIAAVADTIRADQQSVVMHTTYRDGTTKSEQLR